MEYKTRCEKVDENGFNLLFGDEIEDYDDDEVPEKVFTETEIESNGNSDSEGESDKKESVQKWQFNYNSATCFINNYPEMDYREDTSEELSVAPSEGKIQNLL